MVVEQAVETYEGNVGVLSILVEFVSVPSSRATLQIEERELEAARNTFVTGRSSSGELRYHVLARMGIRIVASLVGS